MQLLLARTLRYLATRFLADPDPERTAQRSPERDLDSDPEPTDRDQRNQHTARTNAAEASAILRRRRHDRDEVDEYLRTRSLLHGTASVTTGQGGHDTRRSL